MKVLLLEEIVLQERSRIEHMINSYEEELAALPKGRLSRKRYRAIATSTFSTATGRKWFQSMSVRMNNEFLKHKTA
jgi:hypothetical protein